MRHGQGGGHEQCHDDAGIDQHTPEAGLHQHGQHQRREARKIGLLGKRTDGNGHPQPRKGQKIVARLRPQHSQQR